MQESLNKIIQSQWTECQVNSDKRTLITILQKSQPVQQRHLNNKKGEEKKKKEENTHTEHTCTPTK
jgi:hypothetical protein